MVNFLHYDAIVVGAGFYGSALAAYLVRERGFEKVLLIERESDLMLRASYNNQARVHNGYHYPRSFTTAYRSRLNLPRFVSDWPEIIFKDFTKLYAIARRNSKVTAKQFLRFCHQIGAEIEVASAEDKSLFESRLIEEVFFVKEYSFDSTKLAKWIKKELDNTGVRVMYACEAIDVRQVQASGKSLLSLKAKILGKENDINSSKDDVLQFEAPYIFNCTYSGLNQFMGKNSTTVTRLKHEITEMGLVDMPAQLKDIGVTVMDGPFFSMMPFPARGLHTLSHVRYTPHLHWFDESGFNPYTRLNSYEKMSRVDRMIRDVGRYMPFVHNAERVDSLFEVKTVLVKNEGDDGRPILFEKHKELSGFYSILGGKIDNIYDVFERLEKEPLCCKSSI